MKGSNLTLTLIGINYPHVYWPSKLAAQLEINADVHVA